MGLKLSFIFLQGQKTFLHGWDSIFFGLVSKSEFPSSCLPGYFKPKKDISFHFQSNTPFPYTVVYIQLIECIANLLVNFIIW